MAKSLVPSMSLGFVLVVWVSGLVWGGLVGVVVFFSSAGFGV